MTIARWIFAVVVIALVSVIALSSLKPRSAPPVQVHTATAARMSITRTVTGAGKLEPERKINVSSNITGVLLDLKVEIGSSVQKGQVIGQIDTSRYKAQFQQQQAQLHSAQADTDRARANVAYLASEEKRAQQLVDSKVSGTSELDKARSARALAQAELNAAEGKAKMARAGLDEARSALGWATLTAPQAGTVLSINHRVGERVRGSDFAEDVILVLGSVGEVDVKLEVGEQDVVFIKTGQTASVEIDAFGDRTFPGKVIETGRDAIVKNEGTENEVTTFPIWVALDGNPPRALSGMSAQVTISTETRKDVVTAPIQAVTVRPAGGAGAGGAGGTGAGAAGAGKGAAGAAGSGAAGAGAAVASDPPAGKARLEKVVFVVESGKVSRRAVEVGLSSDTRVEITRGLKPGEVVVEGPYRTLARELEDGMAVTNAPEGGPGGHGGAKQ
ncbi:MAG TPA: efflux RND transporter periplasmic adaptor subunit [Kofleriaceae bacterium]|nr:efflux RND transporter periplasmic adaptor subunit [Kofleriaceae bacterium]